MAIAGFPNLFITSGPGSPSIWSSMVVTIEQHVEWIAGCIARMQREGIETIDVDPAAQEAWMAHVAEVANMTLHPRYGTYYNGANVPGKPVKYTFYLGGFGNFRRKCDDVAANGYEGFHLHPTSKAQPAGAGALG